MKNTYSNPCSRCGTERVIVRTWKERVGNSIVTNTEKKCPNPECQKIVDLENKKLRDKNAALKLRSEQRAIDRRAAQATAKAKKKK